MTRRDLFILIAMILIPECVGLVAAVVTPGNAFVWYGTLTRPGLSAPNFLFGPVWSFLFLLMGIAAYRVWSYALVAIEQRMHGIYLFSVQLALNLLWLLLFFWTHTIGAALVVVVALWFAVFVNLIVFYRVSRMAGYLLVPYLAWATFAVALNYFIWTLN